MSTPRRLVVAITGASGGVRRAPAAGHGDADGWETHLICSPSGLLTVHHELGLQRRDVEALADVVHNVRDIGASVASGSFRCDGMVIAPCSMRWPPWPPAWQTTCHPRRRRDAQGAPPAGAAGARDTAAPGAPAQHDHGDGDGRHRDAAGAGLLYPSTERGRHRGPHGRPRARPVRRRARGLVARWAGMRPALAAYHTDVIPGRHHDRSAKPCRLFPSRS
jgi:hypothetical protein